MIPHVSELRKLLVSLDDGQHDALETFVVKRSTISVVIKELLNDISTEFDRSSPVKNITDMLNLGELQLDDISATFFAKKTKKYIPIR